jgi:hypothetical protein
MPTQGRVAPATGIIITSGSSMSSKADAFDTPYSGRSQRKEQAKRHEKSLMVTPSINIQNALFAPTSGALTAPILLRSVLEP